MNSDREHRDKVGAGRAASTFQKMERMPVLLVMLYLGLVGITVLFVVLVVAYARLRYSTDVPIGNHPFPRYFSLSTIVLLVSSYTISQAKRLYQQDDMQNLVRCLGATLLLSSIFAGLQLLGWNELRTQGVLLNDPQSATGTFVYLISGLHVVHLFGGMLFLLALLLRTIHASRDGVRNLVFIRNPYRRLQLHMITVYWHFIDVLWVGLFAAFLFLY
ncbi:cytochrome c oxidase subunit III [Hymenobacter taeanensis]|uniref:Cytochrome c oxidase subunit III n=1 Tax=Hymenobacter taeanensis TaxID=2735321 RepID=A0A6M6BIU7_9BACT|nr:MULTISPECIES: cytochrome c oxidase subunit 3 [Hymenobacter]QJX48501.1 cytochrome c oxidase subunit III [Hymenobacter taeanensis]UOQ82002.1 cytochrome c oxidase subunit 3 [Hymenobacter sp. 5414T-23]